MALDWIPRAPRDMKQDHQICSEERLQRTEPPRTTYALKPIFDQEGKEVKGLYAAWVTLDNERMGNSYTLDMLAGVACAFDKASHDSSVVAIVLTGMGDRFFCTGGNVKEYAEYYVGRPMSCQEYMTVYWHIFDVVWYSPKPVIRRVQGMSIGGGEEVSGVCDLTVAADTASFGQVGPRHGSTAMGGACQFKSVVMTPEDALWNTTACEQWSAYKMLRKNYILKVVPILKKDGEFMRNPQVITDKWLDGGDIVYGEFKSRELGYSGEETKEAADMVKKLPRDASLLDKAVNDIVWTYANLYPQQVGLSLGMLRAQKKVAYERTKAEIIWWWAANALPYGEFDMGMSAFNTSKITGTRDADVIKYRQLLAEGNPMGAELYEEVMPRPRG